MPARIPQPRAASVPVVYSPAHLRHAPTFETNCGEPIAMLEVPRRAEEIRRELADDERFTFIDPTSHGDAPIDAVHDRGLRLFLERAWREVVATEPHRRQVVADTYLNARLREGMGLDVPEPTNVFGALGYWGSDTATPIVEGTYGAAREAVDVALTAADAVIAGAAVTYALCRPPGHHAPRAAFAGYCYFNNAAIAVEHLIAGGSARVTVLDVDYHHGNGTQQIFFERPDVQYVSLHGDPRRAYPYFAGFADEIGAGRGRGTTLNLPLPVGCDDDGYRHAMHRACDEIDRFRPDIVVVSLGVDTFGNDPIGDFALTRESFRTQGAMVAALDRPVLVVQEGGYDVEALGDNVHAWLDGVVGARNKT
ncbi:MAG: histone deacetylase family protein [Acidimicrobiia bacterium]